jgi:hypothetical protein
MHQGKLSSPPKGRPPKTTGAAVVVGYHLALHAACNRPWGEETNVRIRISLRRMCGTRRIPSERMQGDVPLLSSDVR